MWLGNGAEVRLEDQRLHILLPDGFKLERLRRGRKDILAAAAEVLGFEPELVLAVNKPLPLFDNLEPAATDVDVRRGSPTPPKGPTEGLPLPACVEPAILPIVPSAAP